MQHLETNLYFKFWAKRKLILQYNFFYEENLGSKISSDFFELIHSFFGGNCCTVVIIYRCTFCEFLFKICEIEFSCTIFLTDYENLKLSLMKIRLLWTVLDYTLYTLKFLWNWLFQNMIKIVWTNYAQVFTLLEDRL